MGRGVREGADKGSTGAFEFLRHADATLNAAECVCVWSFFFSFSPLPSHRENDLGGETFLPRATTTLCLGNPEEKRELSSEDKTPRNTS